MAPIGRNYCPFALVLKQITHIHTHTGTGEKKHTHGFTPKLCWAHARTHTDTNSMHTTSFPQSRRRLLQDRSAGQVGKHPRAVCCPTCCPNTARTHVHTHTVAFPLHRMTALPSCADEGSQGPSSGDDGECKSRYSFTAHFPFASAIAPANDSRHGLARNGVTFCTERGCVCVAEG